MRKIVVVSLLLVLVGSGGYYFYKNNQNKKAVKQLEEITVERRDLILTIQSTGVVEPENKVEILPPISGRIEEIKVEEGEDVTKGQLLAWMSSTQRAALMDIASSKPVSEQKTLKETYRPTPIYAPVDGRIIKRAIVPGQTVSAATILFEMSDRLVVRAQVDETDLSSVKDQMPAIITVDAYPHKRWQSEVVRIAMQSRVINNVNIYDVLIAFTETPEGLRSGMTANVDFIIAQKKQATTLPVWSVNKKSEFSGIVEVKGKGELEIDLGMSDGKYIEVQNLPEDTVVLVKPLNLKEFNSGGSPFSFGGRSSDKKKDSNKNGNRNNNR